MLIVAGASAVLLTAAPAQPELVLHKEGTTLYHRPACPVVREGAGVLALTRGQAELRGLKPHPACDPANPKAVRPPPADAPPEANAPAPPVTVYIAGPKYYHRQTCRRIDGSSASVKAVPLTAAAKTHWPCPVCKAPVLKRSTEPAVPGTNRRRGG